MRAAVDRSSWNATAIIGARSGRIGTRNRAGALEPPHHMYIRVELATNAPTVVSSDDREQPELGLAQHHPATERSRAR